MSKRIAVLLANDFEDSELRQPVDELEKAGHDVQILGTEKGTKLTGKQGEETVVTDAAIADHQPDQFDGVLIPGGYSPDQLRTEDAAVSFVKKSFESGRPIAAVCHGPQLLIEAGVVSGKKMTSWPSVKTDLKNAGADWVDEEVVVDGSLITSRKPDDLPAFTSQFLKQLGA